MARAAQPRFTATERRLVARLDSPEKVQDWLHRLPYNWERQGETLRTVRGVVQHNRAHCLEAALAAAAILEQHGYPPLLLDLESVDLLDHVVFLFERNGKWGTIGRSREPGLHGRKPVFSSVPQIVATYAAPFIDATGRLKGYGVFDLRTLHRDWRTSPRNVWFVQDALNAQRHHPYKTPEAEYQRWKRRFDYLKARYPKAKPTWFPGKHNWM